jgi:hypothetical protein
MPQNDVTDPSSVNDGDLTTPVGRGFPRRQIAKGVAVVLSGYDSTTAAVSVIRTPFILLNYIADI